MRLPCELHRLHVERFDKLSEGTLAAPVSRKSAVETNDLSRKSATGNRLLGLADL